MLKKKWLFELHNIVYLRQSFKEKETGNNKAKKKSPYQNKKRHLCQDNSKRNQNLLLQQISWYLLITGTELFQLSVQTGLLFRNIQKIK